MAQIPNGGFGVTQFQLHKCQGVKRIRIVGCPLQNSSQLFLPVAQDIFVVGNRP